jgi:hypothetical protein
MMIANKRRGGLVYINGAGDVMWLLATTREYIRKQVINPNGGRLFHTPVTYSELNVGCYNRGISIVTGADER